MKRWKRLSIHVSAVIIQLTCFPNMSKFAIETWDREEKYFRNAPSNNEGRKLREPATTLFKSGFIRKVCCSACSRQQHQRSLITDHLSNEPALSSAACLSFFSCLCDRGRRRWCRCWTCVILRLFFLSSSRLRLGSVVRKEGRAPSFEWQWASEEERPSTTGTHH